MNINSVGLKKHFYRRPENRAGLTKIRALNYKSTQKFIKQNKGH